MNKAISRCAAIALAVLSLGHATPAHPQDLTEAIADAAGVPNIPAFLPDRYSVAKTDPMPIDGVWLISTLRKKIRIESGRAYAMDPWLHLFVLKVQPDMVVMQNFRRTSPGAYSADDLPLLGPATLRLQADGNIDVSVQGKLGPVRYGLVKLEETYPDRLRSEIRAMAGGDSGRYDTDGYDREHDRRDYGRYDDRYDDRGQADDGGAPGFGADPGPGAIGADGTQRAAEPPPEDCVPVNVDPRTGELVCA